MSTIQQMLTIAGTEITTDEAGRFNLNTLHRASGLGANKAPAQWQRTQTAKDLVVALDSDMQNCTSPINAVKGNSEGVHQGTFAHELLAVSYAGWISPTFQLKVNQAFIDLRSGRISSALPDFSDEVAAARAWADQREKTKVLEIEDQKKTEKIAKLENYFQKGMTMAAFAKTLNGVNSHEISNFCAESLNWTFNESRSGNSKRWRVRSHVRDVYLTETGRPIGQHGDEAFIKHEVKLLQKGAQKLYELYLEGGLPMKKTWNGELTHLKITAVAA